MRLGIFVVDILPDWQKQRQLFGQPVNNRPQLCFQKLSTLSREMQAVIKKSLPVLPEEISGLFDIPHKTKNLAERTTALLFHCTPDFETSWWRGRRKALLNSPLLPPFWPHNLQPTCSTYCVVLLQREHHLTNSKTKYARRSQKKNNCNVTGETLRFGTTKIRKKLRLHSVLQNVTGALTWIPTVSQLEPLLFGTRWRTNQNNLLPRNADGLQRKKEIYETDFRIYRNASLRHCDTLNYSFFSIRYLQVNTKPYPEDSVHIRPKALAVCCSVRCWNHLPQERSRWQLFLKPSPSSQVEAKWVCSIWSCSPKILCL